MTDEAKREAVKHQDSKRSDTWADDQNWADDQKRRSYYYDDSSGYEKFDPELEDDESETTEEDVPGEEDELT